MLYSVRVYWGEGLTGLVRMESRFPLNNFEIKKEKYKEFIQDLMPLIDKYRDHINVEWGYD